MSKNLFSEFREVSAKEWKQKIQFDLKGADYNETLVWKSPDGINVKPFYHPDDSPAPARISSVPHWNITEQIYVSSAEKANKRAQKVLKKGTESLWFILPSEEVDLNALFEGLSSVDIHIKPQFFSEEFFLKLGSQKRENKIFLQLDIIGNLARSGNWYHDQKKDHEILQKVVEKNEYLESVISIDASLYQNAGANIPQQLAYALAHANEYFNHFANLQKEKKKEFKLQFIVSAGPNYFFEIAKIRALRVLVATLAREYDLPEDCFILAQPTRRNKTLYDYNVNLLRTTTECMSVILGGANSVCNMPYDAIYHKNNDFGSRIARNQLLILKHESYFDKAANPAEGAYYIESLTHEMADKALDIFKSIEKGGGFVTQLVEGIIQKKIAESAQTEQEEFDSGAIVLIGSNKYPNAADRMKDELELYPFLKLKPRKTLIQPILEKRLSEKTEQERLKKEEQQ